MTIKLVVDNTNAQAKLASSMPKQLDGEDDKAYFNRLTLEMMNRTCTDERISALIGYVRGQKLNPANAALLFYRVAAALGLECSDTNNTLEQQAALLQRAHGVVLQASYNKARAKQGPDDGGVA